MTFRKLHISVQPEQSAVVPYRIRKDQVEVLLITTRGKGKWIVPKGWIEDDLEPHTSAEKEAFEEGGVEGQVSSVSLGCYHHGEDGTCPIVEVFLMRVERELKSWPEDDERSRQWIPLKEAYNYVEEEGLKSILEEATMVVSGAARGPKPEPPSHPAIP